ncbi:MAG: DUF1028 domain-containing protein [Alphaproteobacteria bacterium]|nr:DUF1028 domain-containing protein [Alphaproteobacteria bacterium]
MHLNTFTIVGRCGRTGMLGVAVCTAAPGVGGYCPFVRAKAGAVATMSWVNPYLAIDGLRLMAEGGSARETLDKLIAADPGRAVRQVGMVDSRGGSAAHTGTDCGGWCGHRIGENFSAQGNILVGEATVAAMAETFLATSALTLAERLLLSLEAGQAHGGDARGKQSAALLIHWQEEYPYIDLRVDEHRNPVPELRRVYEVAKHQSLPFVAQMPTRDNPLGSFSAEIEKSMSVAPAYRPGGGGGGSQ